jgi:predicted O-methyltransferase YrrM
MLKPWMQGEQIELIEKVLASFGKKRVDVLEWGASGSTVYFPAMMDKKGIGYSWLSLEHNAKWHRRMQKALQHNPNVKLKLFEVDRKTAAPQDYDDYVSYPVFLNRYFDFILVDGRERARCLMLASNLLNPGGIVFLHDAERERYHHAFDFFGNGVLLESEGKDNPDAWIAGGYEKILNDGKG